MAQSKEFWQRLLKESREGLAKHKKDHTARVKEIRGKKSWTVEERNSYIKKMKADAEHWQKKYMQRIAEAQKHLKKK